MEAGLIILMRNPLKLSIMLAFMLLKSWFGNTSRRNVFVGNYLENKGNLVVIVVGNYYNLQLI